MLRMVKPSGATVDYVFTRLGQPVEQQVSADEAGTADVENGHQ